MPDISVVSFCMKKNSSQLLYQQSRGQLYYFLCTYTFFAQTQRTTYVELFLQSPQCIQRNMASATQDKYTLNDANAQTNMLLCNVEHESKGVLSLHRDGFPLLVWLYFRKPTPDANAYHWSQCTLVLVANAIGALNNNDFGFLIV